MKKHTMVIFGVVALITLGVCGFNFFGFGVVVTELFLFAAGSVGMDNVKANEYLAHKYDEEVKNKKN